MARLYGQYPKSKRLRSMAPFGKTQTLIAGFEWF
ncbi:hypothetical protein FHT80_002072 [Rhizobium sp. BK226]|nr:hypothetical protein [Rhizobium sp. BK226]